MGDSIRFSCSNCDYSAEFLLGVGMMYSSLKNVLDSAVDNKIQREIILDILEHHKVDAAQYEHAVYRCNHCDALTEGLFVKILYDRISKYEIAYACPGCGCQLQHIKRPKSIKGACPSCHNKTLVAGPGGIDWD